MKYLARYLIGAAIASPIIMVLVNYAMAIAGRGKMPLSEAIELVSAYLYDGFMLRHNGCLLDLIGAFVVSVILALIASIVHGTIAGRNHRAQPTDQDRLAGNGPASGLS